MTMPRDARHRGREAALQLLYHWEVGRLQDHELETATELYWQTHPAPDDARELAETLFRGTIAHIPVIDPVIEEQAEHWRLSRMAVVDRLILRLAVYELRYTGTPAAVVIDEAVELAKTFSGDEAARFVNGIVDAVRRRVTDAQREKPGA